MRGQERQPVGLQAVQHSWCLVVHATSSRLLGIDCEPPEAKQARSCGTGGKEKIGVNGGGRGPPDADHSLPAPYSPYCWKPRTLVGPAPRFYPRPDGTAASAPVGATWPRRLPRPERAPARPRPRKESLRRKSAPSSRLAGSESQV